MRVRPKADPSLGWAYRPDTDTVSALARGMDKVKAHPELMSQRPHESGNMAEALAEERKQLAERKRPKRRRQMAKKVSKKRPQLRVVSKKRSGASTKRTGAVAASGNGKLIPLKTICNELDLDPKATRVKLRRLIQKNEIDFHDMSQRWEFTPAQARQIKEHLTG